MENHHPICGRPALFWINLFLMTHQQMGRFWERREWPDGRPLMDQAWPMVQLFRLIEEELNRINSEELKSGRLDFSAG